jgi:hypothetical protein
MNIGDRNAALIWLGYILAIVLAGVIMSVHYGFF